MKNVQKIIDLLGGDAFRHVKLECGGFMPLSIERIGTFGPNNLPMFSVCHYGEQNGDLMAHPELTFVVSPTLKGWLWTPVSFRNDYAGIYQEGERGAMWFDESGKAWTRPRLLKDLKSFASQWDRNLKAQGFVDAALKLANSIAIFEG